MTLQKAKSEEKFMGHNAWFSVFMGISILVTSIYPHIEGFYALAHLTIGLAFLASFIMFYLQGGLKSKKLYMHYQDEFLRAINTKAYKHCAYALVVAFLLAMFLSSNVFRGDLLAELSHGSMAKIYLGIGCITYGLSLLWQNRG